ncbi:MAG TPA: phage tail protein [Xanthobacteraceae bacterium]|nr:phage tail protein [Xanthobacteraceae bacterium]
MSQDTTTPILRLLLQGTGNNNNSWGENLNKYVIEYIENAIVGVRQIYVAGGTLNLTADDQRYATLIFSGLLTAHQNVVLLNTSRNLNIINDTEGAFVLHVKTESGLAIEIPQGTQKKVFFDGAGRLFREDEDEVGNIIHHAGPTLPPGTLACSGGTFVRADHPNLFAKIGTTFGEGNGITTAGLPNFTDTNRFLRAAGGTLEVGTYQASENKAHTHTASATTTVAASGSTSASGDHVHGNWLNDPGHTHGVSGGTLGGTAQRAISLDDQPGMWYPDYIRINAALTGITINNAAGGNHSHTLNITATASTTVTVQSDGGTEARPESAAVLMCIKI